MAEAMTGCGHSQQQTSAESNYSMCLSGAELDKTDTKMNMLHKLAHTDAHFKHQQLGEPDLSTEEKCKIANDLLDKSVTLFLERFSSYLTIEDIDYFSDQSEDYLVQFYLQSIKDHGDVNKSQNKIKNRRYQALQELMNDGDYFSMEEMQRRDPLLFDQMIGQYETEEEKQARDVDRSDMRFSSILLKYMDIQETKEAYDRLKEREEGQEEEEEESDEESEDDGNNCTNENIPACAKPRNGDEGEENERQISEEEQNQLKEEFVHIMQERFLGGKDRDFDYSKVDTNVAYDSMAILNQDAEDKYFACDDESPDKEMDAG